LERGEEQILSFWLRSVGVFFTHYKMKIDILHKDSKMKKNKEKNEKK
jgi:hypothetical protein